VLMAIMMGWSEPPEQRHWILAPIRAKILPEIIWACCKPGRLAPLSIQTLTLGSAASPFIRASSATGRINAIRMSSQLRPGKRKREGRTTMA
jgi:hypothetical protein